MDGGHRTEKRKKQYHYTHALIRQWVAEYNGKSNVVEKIKKELGPGKIRRKQKWDRKLEWAENKDWTPNGN